MNKKAKFLLVPAVALGVIGLTGAPAFAATGDAPASYQAELAQLNESGASRTVMVTVDGDQATVKMSVEGLAEVFNGDPYPHVEHIHVGGDGICPTPDADASGDGLVDTVEGQPAYGMIATTLSTSGDTSPKAGTDLKVAGMGGSYDYNRTFTMNVDTIAGLEDGTASVAVHGLDPSTLSQEAQDATSNLGTRAAAGCDLTGAVRNPRGLTDERDAEWSPTDPWWKHINWRGPRADCTGRWARSRCRRCRDRSSTYLPRFGCAPIPCAHLRIAAVTAS